MKLTRDKLKQIIKEELSEILNSEGSLYPPGQEPPSMAQQMAKGNDIKKQYTNIQAAPKLQQGKTYILSDSDLRTKLTVREVGPNSMLSVYVIGPELKDSGFLIKTWGTKDPKNGDPVWLSELVKASDPRKALEQTSALQSTTSIDKAHSSGATFLKNSLPIS